MKTGEFIRLYHSLFAGRPDVYAILNEYEKDGKKYKNYYPSTYSSDKPKKQFLVEKIQRIAEGIGSAEYTVEAAEAHLVGSQFLGVYPLHQDSTVKFFALDFDGKTLEEALEQAVEQQGILRDEADLTTYLEISRSGSGVHLWGFLDEPADARKVRVALRPFLLQSSSYDRMFPNQDSVNELRPLGNLIALPLYGPSVAAGKGVFVKQDGVPYPDQKAFLAKVKRNSVDHLYELFADAPEEFHRSTGETRAHTEPTEGLSGAYKLISEFGCEWVRWHWEQPEEPREPDWYMLACQLTKFANGRDLFHEFSARSDRYDADQTDAKYDHALEQNAPNTCAYIREHTQGPPCQCDSRWPGRVTHPYDIAELSIRELIEVVEEEAPAHSSKTLIVSAIERAARIEADPESEMGLRYGLEELDAHTSLRPGELIVIGARPGMGKTALGGAIAVNVVNEQDAPAYFISMEMTAAQLGMRFLAQEAMVDHTRLLTGTMRPEDWAAVEAARVRVEGRHRQIYVDDRTRDTDRVLDVVGEWVFEHGPGPLIVDYLQLAKKRSGESTQDAVTRFANNYKWIAKVLGIPVIALTQLNRSADEATSESATFDYWLKSSGDIEQSADVIIFLLGEKTGEAVVARTAALHKERHRGGGHRVQLDFNQGQQRFATEGTWRQAAARQTGRFDIGMPIIPMRRPILQGATQWGE